MSPILFKAINEHGSTERLAGGDQLFSFEYASPFYGSCRLVAEVQKGSNGKLDLDEGSLRVEECDPKRGEPPVIVQNATLFFRRALSSYSSIDELQTTTVKTFYPFPRVRRL